MFLGLLAWIRRLSYKEHLSTQGSHNQQLQWDRGGNEAQVPEQGGSSNSLKLDMALLLMKLSFYLSVLARLSLHKGGENVQVTHVVPPVPGTMPT